MAMQNCWQSPQETVWQHCQNVSRIYLDLMQNPDKYSLPSVIRNNFQKIQANQAPSQIVRDYLEWHDCGKPYCATTIEGRTSFPNHAAISKDLFLRAGGNPESAKLIGLDMLFHTTKPAEMKNLTLDTPTLFTLMMSGWAALFSNAQMFGGFESESYKIKASQMTSRCKKILNI